MGKSLEDPEILFPPGPHSLGLESLKRKQREDMRRKRQQQLCELMSMYQVYHKLLWLKQQNGYTPRGSILVCQYGTKPALLDCLEDHGGLTGNLPVLTCNDCTKTNIHNFGSCMCPEWRYENRLPMTASVHPNGHPAKYLPGNSRPHICVPLINTRWIQSEGDMAVVDEDMVAHMLVKNAVLVCQYGGLIRIEKVAEQEESPKEELEWIPSYVMQLGGNRDSEKELTSRIETLNQSIKDSSLIWNQAKIDYLWEICKEFYENYGIQVDPRILLDIICDEGTGSFDTSSTNKASDGGNGPENDFAVDCKKAIDIVGGKIIVYRQFYNEFDDMLNKSRSYRGLEKSRTDVLTYINWKTPRLCVDSQKFESGEYAEDNHWNGKVRAIYSSFFEQEDSKRYK